MLNPTDVHDPALSTVNASVTEITSPARATQSRAKKAIGDEVRDNGTDLEVENGTDLDYDSDSKDGDYRGDIYEDDYSDDEESLGQYRVPSARGNGAGRKPKAGRPPKPDTTGMSEEDASAALTDWAKKWKRDNDTNRRTAAAAAALQEFDESLDLSGHQFTGVCSRTLREMKDVELHPLRKGDTFLNKELVMLRIAEEANLFAIRIQTRRSDLFQLQVYGAGGDPFHVHANYRTAKNMWVVTECEVRIGRTKYVPRRGSSYNNGQDGVLSVSDKIIDPEDFAGRPDEDETFEEGIFEGEGNADDDSDKEDAEDEDDGPKKMMKARVKSPMKSKWLVPLVKGPLAEKPNISNKALIILLNPYVVDKFLTHSLINQTKKLLRLHLFGDPAQNVTYLPELIRELKSAGHDYHIVTKSNASVLQKIEEMVLMQHIGSMEASGVKLIKEQKIDFIKEWRKENKALLLKVGLGEGSSERCFVTGIFVSLSTARATVPLLQTVYQADAAHTNFGKYTLYSCYGVSSNGNTFPVCLAIIFGNEDKEGWTMFWEFASRIHRYRIHISSIKCCE